MLKARVTCSANPHSRLLIMRCIGNLDGPAVAERMQAHLEAIPDAWDYDHIVDFSRFNGLFLGDDTEDMTAWWRGLASDRDAGRLTAVISDDPLMQVRQSICQDLLPLREVAIFSRFSEGCDWIVERRRPPRVAA